MNEACKIKRDTAVEIRCSKCDKQFDIGEIKVEIRVGFWCTVCPACGFSFSISSMPGYAEVVRSVVLPEPKGGETK